MADEMTLGREGERAITVEFVADGEVADADRLCRWLHDEIERHLLSITEIPIDEWNIDARIKNCRMEPHSGAVQVALSGTINRHPIEELISVDDKPAPTGYTIEEQHDKATKLAFANLFTLLGRLFFPSELVRALGRRRISGRLVRAWQDCCREIRIVIDRTIGRPESGGRQMLRRTMVTAFRAGLFFTALSIIDKLLSRRHHADHFRAWLGCGLIGIGVFGAVAASGLLLLPSRFYQAEQQGLDLVRLFGVKSVAGIRVVAFGLFAISVLFGVAPGIYWLFFE